jgi:hypothetical protein
MNGEFQKLFCPRDFLLVTTFAVLLELGQEARTPEISTNQDLIHR